MHMQCIIINRPAAALAFLTTVLNPIAKFFNVNARGPAVQFSSCLYTGWQGKTLFVHRLAGYKRPIYIITECSCMSVRQPWHGMQ